MKKHINVHNVENYFSLPKKKRQRFGIYLVPMSLPYHNDKSGWTEFSHRIRKEYPIQGFIREYLFDYDNPVYAFIMRFYQSIKDLRYNIKHLLKPAHPRLHKAYPRYVWKDITEAIVDVNFAMILDFYYEEVVDGHVDWEADEPHKEFMRGVFKCIDWIENGLPEAEKELEDAYDKVNHELPYPDAYQNVEEIEKRIETETEKVLIFMIKNRAFFWT